MGDPFVRPGVKTQNPNAEALIRRHVGTGDADTTAHEWLEHQHKDTLALMLDHPDHVAYAAVAENVSMGRMRAMLLSQLAGKPCGVAPVTVTAKITGGGKRQREEGGL